MEVFIVVGMIAAFFAGAYVRQPFCIEKRTRDTIPEKPAQIDKEDRQAEQLNNLMNYNGRKQYPEEEE